MLNYYLPMFNFEPRFMNTNSSFIVFIDQVLW